MIDRSCFPLILTSVVLNTLAQILLKHGMNQIGIFEFSLRMMSKVAVLVVTNISILIGLFCYGFSLIVWLLTLSRMDVSIAYPLASLGYIATACIGCFIFQEPLSLSKISGVIIIMIGVYFVSRG